jgi:uncharacterized SAM-binding protein YcdF (DUF218 family)
VSIIVYGLRDTRTPSDAIVLLGSGVEADGTPSRTLQVRSEHAAALWHAGVAPLVICAGGVTGNAPRSEAAACAEVLLAAGVAADAVHLEERSINTEQNVTYTRELLAELDAATVVVVSSRYHLLRARWLFGRVGQPITVSPAPIGYLTAPEILYAYTREVAAFHWQLLRDRFDTPHIYVPVP